MIAAAEFRLRKWSASATRPSRGSPRCAPREMSLRPSSRRPKRCGCSASSSRVVATCSRDAGRTAGRVGRAMRLPAVTSGAAGVCGKPTVRCGVCPNQAFEPFDGAVLLGHLRGRQIVGVYPLLEDDTCWFCAIDLDGDGLARRHAAQSETAAHELGIPVAVERSRSGNGAHVWIFFAEASPCRRRPAPFIRRLDGGDSAPAEHWLGLVRPAVPEPGRDAEGWLRQPDRTAASSEPRGSSGCSVFVDDEFIPFADQWAYLARVERVEPGRLELVVASRPRGGRAGSLAWRTRSEHPDEPWRARGEELPLSGPLPSEVRAVLAQQLYVRARRPAAASLRPNPKARGFCKSGVLRAAAAAALDWPRAEPVGCAEEHARPCGPAARMP